MRGLYSKFIKQDTAIKTMIELVVVYGISAILTYFALKTGEISFSLEGYLSFEATIFAYAKDIEWYKVVPIQTLLNVMIVIVSYSVLNIINFDMSKDMAWYMIIVACVAVFSIIEFTYSFKHIEEVCR